MIFIQGKFNYLKSSKNTGEILLHLSEFSIQMLLHFSYGYHCSRISYYLYDGVEVLRKIFDPLRNFGGAVNTVGIYSPSYRI